MKNIISCSCFELRPETTEKALLFLRVGIGFLSVCHGMPKFMGGTEQWQQLGMAMNSLGIHFLPVMWGFAAAVTEFFGGIALTLGIGTRLVALLEALAMIVAFIMHFRKGDPFTVYSFALTLIIVFITFIIIGGGKYSLDHRLHKQHN